MYIDPQFFDEFSQMDKEENEIIYDFEKKFLRKVRGIKIVMSNITEDEFKTKALIDRCYSDLAEISPNISFNIDWITQVDSIGTIPDENPVKLFLVANSFDCKNFEKKYGFLFVNCQNLIEKWKSVMWDREINELSLGNIIDDFTFNSWDFVSKEIRQVKEALILDLYILEDKANQKISNNLVPMILSLKKNAVSDFKIFIVTNRILRSPDEKKYKHLIEAYQYLKEKIIGVDICIIHFDKAVKFSSGTNEIINPEHDREIYTNYLKLKSGSGWNLFNEQNKVNGNRTSINIQSLFRNDVRNTSKIAFDNLRLYKSAIKNGIIKLVPGEFDAEKKMKTKSEYLHHPINVNSLLLNC
jgi:glycosyltransferase involved in cell wall biosynthesis